MLSGIEQATVPLLNVMPFVYVTYPSSHQRRLERKEEKKRKHSQDEWEVKDSVSFQQKSCLYELVHHIQQLYLELIM